MIAPNVAGGFIPTYTGRRVHIVNPNPDELNIMDIALGLSNVCRFAGQVKAFYSVAQHSVLVSELLDERTALWGLLHDASEAYLHDLTRPLKHAMGALPETTDWVRYQGDSVAHDLADRGMVAPDAWLIVANVITTALLEERFSRGLRYAELERRMMEAVCLRFGLSTAMPAEVVGADNVALATELRDVCGAPPEDCVSWSGARPLDRAIKPMCPEAARDLFLVRFEKLAHR